MRLGWRWAALRNGLQDATAYRLEFILELIGYAAVPAATQLVLWYAMFNVGGSERVAGLTYAEMIAYTLVSVLFSQVRGGNHDFEIAELIRSGGLSNYLLRPVSVVQFIYLRGLGARLVTAGGCLALGFLLCPFLGMSPLRLLGAMLLALVGNIIHYLLSIAMASAAFYWEEAYSVLMVKNMVVQLLSGELLPLTLFPERLSWIWKYAPFYLYVFGPSQYALGRWSDLEYARQMGIACLWLLFSFGLLQVSWGLGMRRYISLGN